MPFFIKIRPGNWLFALIILLIILIVIFVIPFILVALLAVGLIVGVLRIFIRKPKNQYQGKPKAR